jgi:alpha-tubulin suppressor-like RCC1 family protein
LGTFGGSATRRLRPTRVFDDVVSATQTEDFIAATFVIRNDGSLWAWGNNRVGELGNGSTIDHQRTPIRIMENVDFVSASNASVIAVTTDGTRWAWGLNSFGQLRDGTTINRRTPMRSNIVSSSRSLRVALMSDGFVREIGGISVGTPDWTNTRSNGRNVTTLPQNAIIMDDVMLPRALR